MFSKTYDLKSVCHDSDSHQLLAVVATVHHQRVGQSLDDRALSLSESLCGISTGRVRSVDGGSDLNVVATGVLLAFCSTLFPWISSVRQGDVPNFYILIRPACKEANGTRLTLDILW